MLAYPVSRMRSPFIMNGGFQGPERFSSTSPLIPSVSRIGQNTPAPDATPAAKDAEKEKLGLEKIKILEQAINAYNEGAWAVIQNLEKVYSDYTHYETKSWIRSIAAYMVFPPAAITVLLIDSWNQASDAQKARIVIMSSLHGAQLWMNSVQEKFFPVFGDQIAEFDPGKAKKLDEMFQSVVDKFSRNTQLMVDISNIPAVWAGRGLQVFFPELAKQVDLMLNRFANFALALEAILRALAKMAEAGTKATTVAPYVVIGGIALVGLIILLK